MSRPFVVVAAHHAQGLAAYRAGLSIKEIMTISGEIELMHEQVPHGAEDANAQHDEIAAAGPSLIAGFADGLIDDIRNIARSPGFQRRGQSA
jgi:hypothetical protein